MKKILIISNNPIRVDNNNGSTIGSFFRNYPNDCIAQIYIENSYPDFSINGQYFRITDKDVLKSLFNFNSVVGCKINKETDLDSSVQNSNNTREISTIFRILRELMWGIKTWKRNALKSWLLAFKPDIIFFCMGDSGFMYDIVDYCLKLTKAKLVVYVTDDYILNRDHEKLIDAFRRRIIRRKMEKAVKRSQIFFTISELMREKYFKIFNKKSTVVMNLPKEKNIKEDIKVRTYIRFIYCGNLEYGRSESLQKIGNEIKKYNEKTNNIAALLHIYSADSDIAKNIVVENASIYCGKITKREVDYELVNSDVLVHVESFQKKYIEKTLLSVSTKISEYFSVGKPILAIGPSNIASMDMLKNIAYCVNDESQIEKAVLELTQSIELRKKLSNNCKKSYELYKKKMPSDLVVNMINDLELRDGR